MQRPKVLLWRPMYYPGGHKMLEERGMDVVVVDSSDPGEVKPCTGRAPFGCEHRSA
jgi:hypothetical protein